MPMAPRSTTGIFSRPLLMYWTFAIWLSSSPIASRIKSTNMKSTTGRPPAMAAPVHSPTKPRSLMGVSRRRSGPNRSYRPAVVMKLPPRAPMPSPRTKMDGSRSMASASTSRVASTNVISRMRLASGLAVDVLVGGGRIRPGAVPGKLGRGLHLCLHLRFNRLQVRRRGAAQRQQVLLEALDGVFRLPGVYLLARAIAGVAHALGVRARAIGAALNQRRPAARARPAHGLARRAVDGQHVIAVDADGGQAIGHAAVGHFRVAGRIRKGHLGRIQVVLADKDHRQLPDGGQVDAFVKGAIAYRAIAEEGHADAAGLEQLEGVAGASGLQDVGADDAGGAHQPHLGANRCMLPPRPREQPVARPNNSAMSALGATPLASACPWPRCVLKTTSSLCRLAHTPVATASSPT